MFDAFRQHKKNGARYYTKWRCEATPDSSVGAASAKVDELNSQQYNLGYNNCLTRSVAIFKAYDAPVFAGMSSEAVNSPNYVFGLLDGFGFGPVHTDPL